MTLSEREGPGTGAGAGSRGCGCASARTTEAFRTPAFDFEATVLVAAVNAWR
ncbi:hypothetical protein SBD_0158 [Streptomyces bottropensis ATCC 25435]|uniref:Uncharacterized protein n=1 Tax=Streptomyces bottropensis ATCC 25435 TaxID=1054862 RepID=M3FWT0_9ACTN|nr:hypothetical protein SBD_0158 [Streptomyces bottropensis ATCC 25435]